MSSETMDSSESSATIDSAADRISSPACCAGAGALRLSLMAVVTIASLCIAAFFAGRYVQLRSQPSPGLDALPSIHASASANLSNKFSIATGQASDDAEGVFVLDHGTGLLQCNVINPRTARFNAQFTVNVGDALGGGKGGDYLLVTGGANFTRNSNRPAAPVVVYVLDTATGDFACYGIPYDRGAIANNRSQQGTMVLLHTGKGNPVIDRDNLR